MPDRRFDLKKLTQHLATSYHRSWWLSQRACKGRAESGSPAIRGCVGLTGPEILPLFDAKYDWGGISEGCIIWSSIAEKLFPYKYGRGEIGPAGREANTHATYSEWTMAEKRQFDADRRRLSLWYLDRMNRSVQSTSCLRSVTGRGAKQDDNAPDNVCDQCLGLQHNPRFRKALQKVSRTNQAGNI